MKEVFENYHLEGGIRIPTDFIGSEAYALLENNKKMGPYFWHLSQIRS